MRFVGNYNEIIPNESAKQRFLLQCTKSVSSHAVTCADVASGSIAVTFAGTTSNLESAYVSLSTNGLVGISGFPDLPFYIPSSLPTSAPTPAAVSDEIISEGSESSSSNNILIIIVIFAILLLCSVVLAYFFICRTKNEHQSNLSLDNKRNSCIDLVESKRTIGECSYEAGDQNYKRDASGLKQIPQRQEELNHMSSEGSLAAWPLSQKDSAPEIEGLDETSQGISQVGESNHESLEAIIVPGSNHHSENSFVEVKRSAHNQGDNQPGANGEVHPLSSEDGAFI